MRIDPFSVKRWPKYHPIRLSYTAWARLRERLAASRFDECALPVKQIAAPVASAAADWSNTSVTPLQLGQLLAAVEATEGLASTVIVEVGAFRGATTRVLATRSRRRIVVVDPYRGYGGSEEDLALFRSATADLSNVVHKRQTSGDAVRAWDQTQVGLVFIDAVHDYVNTTFDIGAWSPLLVPGGVVALHDTDAREFAGTRVAAFEASRHLELFAHVDGLVVLRKPYAVG